MWPWRVGLNLSALLALPGGLLFYAGCLLFPIAVFMALPARQARPWATGVWIFIVGYAAWVPASVVVLLTADPNALGAAFLVAQALVVALLGLAEFNSLGRRPAGIA